MRTLKRIHRVKTRVYFPSFVNGRVDIIRVYSIFICKVFKWNQKSITTFSYFLKYGEDTDIIDISKQGEIQISTLWHQGSTWKCCKGPMNYAYIPGTYIVCQRLFTIDNKKLIKESREMWKINQVWVHERSLAMFDVSYFGTEIHIQTDVLIMLSFQYHLFINVRKWIFEHRF